MSSQEPLPSWNEGPAKRRILQFVASVTDAAGLSYVPPADRIAAFDNDGTLWCEQPAYVQAFFARHRLRKLAEAHPELRQQEPYRAVLEGDQAYFHALALPAVAQVILESHAGMTPEEFDAVARSFLATATHPRFGVRFTELTYQPMLELLAFLRANGFRSFLVTGGGIDFARAFSETVYGIAREDVTGSAVQVAFERRRGKAVLVREAKLLGSPDEGPPKAMNLELHIGRRPILAVGNSPGDREMLEYAQGSSYPSLCLLVNHDDAQREYAYESKAGTFTSTERILDVAAQLDWTVISMKRDFKIVFGFNR
jgi:phosphoglycolate phosphatase-like HAD superfamily hydrolase